jgi:hypothetical protein
MSLPYGNFAQLTGISPYPAESVRASAPPAAPANNLESYYELGMQLLQRQMQMMQQQQASQPAMLQATPGSLNLGNDQLTSGFDMNWLDQRLAAGSANGASIQKPAGGGGGRKSGGDDYIPAEHPEDRIAGSERLKDGFWNKARDFSGWGANNKFGFGR